MASLRADGAVEMARIESLQYSSVASCPDEPDRSDASASTLDTRRLRRHFFVAAG